MAKNYDIEIIAPEDEYSQKIIDAGFVFHQIEMASSSISLLDDFYTIKQYYQLLRKINPDFYLGFTAKPNIYGGFISAKLGVKVINNIAGLGRAFSKPGQLQKILTILYKIGLRNSSHIFFQNDDDLALFQSLNVITEQSFSVLPGSGVNTERFYEKALVNHTEYSPFVFLFSARLLLDKGIREFLAAACRIRQENDNVVFHVIGKHTNTRDEIPKLELDTACQQGNVRYLGVTDDMVAAFHSADCFVLPSYYREGVPRTLLEAGSCGLPLITTDSVGCRETVLDGVNGYLIKPRDTDSLYFAMKKMLSLGLDERKKMGHASRAFMCENFKEDIIFCKYKRVMRECL